MIVDRIPHSQIFEENKRFQNIYIYNNTINVCTESITLTKTYERKLNRKNTNHKLV